MPLATPKRSTSTPWTLRGRRKPQPPSIWTTERPPNQEESGSPLTDSNRRPPPYHQRISFVSAVHGRRRFAADCHPLQPGAPSRLHRRFVETELRLVRGGYLKRAGDLGF